MVIYTMKSDDLKEIKQRIYEENRVEELLLAMGCQGVKVTSTRYEAQLPVRFNSPNPRSVQVRRTPTLGCHVYTEGLSNIDIFGLTCYLVLEAKQSDINSKIFEAKKWICSTLGYSISHSASTTPKDVAFGEGFDPLLWLKKLKKKRDKSTHVPSMKTNQIYDESVLQQFDILPYQLYMDTGIEYEIQEIFQVGVDVNRECIIFPIHNDSGEIISVKGRTIISDYKERGIPKFYHYYNYNKMLELYNWHRAISHILERKEIIIFEAEKSCWLATQYGYPNCVALGGCDISSYQVEMIKELGIEVKVIIMFDNDKDYEALEIQADKFGRNRQVYATWDTDGVLGVKDSPVDINGGIFELLYKDSLNNRIVKQDKSKVED